MLAIQCNTIAANTHIFLMIVYAKMYERKLNNCNYLIFLREIWLYNLLCLIVGINGKNMYFYDHQVKPNRVCCPAFSKLGLVRTGVILVFMTI